MGGGGCGGWRTKGRERQIRRTRRTRRSRYQLRHTWLSCGPAVGRPGVAGIVFINGRRSARRVEHESAMASAGG